MQPEFGSRLRDYCFEAYSLRTETLIKDEISKSILLNEPRVDVEDIVVEQTDAVGVLRINIVYVVRSTNSRRNLVFPFYLNEATDASV